MKVQGAISPCPNDTFLFEAWINRRIETPLEPALTFADIETLNTLALTGKPDLCKLSLPALNRVLDRYVMLPVGAAIGFGCGPLLIARELFALEDIRHKCVAIPGENTSAHFLLEGMAPKPRAKRFCLYNESFKLLRAGLCDAALIIHEQRFTFQHHGFIKIADLGKLWQDRTGYPVPLGCLAARRDLGPATLTTLVQTLKKSLQAAWDDRDRALPLILRHSQEMEHDVIQRHIDTYVTADSYELSEGACEAISTMLQTKEWLFQP